LSVPDGQSIVSDAELRRLHDRLYQLEAAVADVTADLADDGSLAGHRAALAHLLDAARDLVGVVVEPVR
jgi:hypothetical protein